MDEPIINDWTDKIIIIDLTNSLGEQFHFEIEPGEEDNLPTRPSSSPADIRPNGTYVRMEFDFLPPPLPL